MLALHLEATGVQLLHCHWFAGGTSLRRPRRTLMSYEPRTLADQFFASEPIRQHSARIHRQVVGLPCRSPGVRADGFSRTDFACTARDWAMDNEIYQRGECLRTFMSAAHGANSSDVLLLLDPDEVPAPSLLHEISSSRWTAGQRWMCSACASGRSYPSSRTGGVTQTPREKLKVRGARPDPPNPRSFFCSQPSCDTVNKFVSETVLPNSFRAPTEPPWGHPRGVDKVKLRVLEASLI